jgi:hypothetical protein
MSRNVEYSKDMLSIVERCKRAQHKALAGVKDFNEQYKLCNRASYEEISEKIAFHTNSNKRKSSKK